MTLGNVIMELQLRAIEHEGVQGGEPAVARLVCDKIEAGEAVATRWRFVKARQDKREPNGWATVSNTIAAFVCATWEGALLDSVNKICF